jgi:hypothetical protein
MPDVRDDLEIPPQPPGRQPGLKQRLPFLHRQTAEFPRCSPHKRRAHSGVGQVTKVIRYNLQVQAIIPVEGCKRRGNQLEILFGGNVYGAILKFGFTASIGKHLVILVIQKKQQHVSVNMLF